MGEKRRAGDKCLKDAMPSISEPFTLTVLPQRSGKHVSTSESRASVTNDEQTAYVGISSSSIASYKLRPTPQLIWSHSLSPVTEVTAIHHRAGAVYFGSFERKRHQLNRVDVAENEQKMVSLEAPAEVCAVRSSDNGELVYAVLKSSEVRCYPASLQSREIWALKVKASRTVVYSAFIPPTDHEDEDDGPRDGSVVTVASRDVGRKAMFEVKVVGLNGVESQEVLSREIEIKDGEFKTGVFTYRDGKLYRYIPALHTIQVYSLLDMSLIGSVVLPTPEKEADPTGQSLLAVDSDKILLCTGYLVLLVDTKHHAVLAQQDTTHHFELLSYVAESGVVLGLSTVLDRSMKASILGLSVDSGRGTLLESLTRGVQPVDTQWKFGFSDILIKKNYPLKEHNTVLHDIIVTSQTHATHVLDELDSLKEQGDARTFGYRLVRYLKGDEWDTIGDEDDSQDAYVYEAENDREVDKDFVFEVVMMIFGENETDGKLTLASNFVPQKGLIYLLTHPLFPTPEVRGLLDALYPYPRLYRQAVVTAPTLDCQDLVAALSQPDDEIFKDIVTRIVEEFGSETIASCIKNEFGRGSTRDTTRIVNCVKRLLRLNVGWTIVSCFLDAGGLFTWDQSVISQLSADVDEQVESLQMSTETMTLIDEVLRKSASEKDTTGRKKSSKKKAAKEPGAIVSAEQRDTQMQGMLELGVTPTHNIPATKDQKKKALLRHANSISKRVPQYTVEKLIL
ncbi:hypothetical protein TRICI_005809 [Trichomonascus ciferrii]|uniref:U3 small nucleolar RNA-associated protein 8 n=1 Tax=Trichomonascus ciferrii TaxID=44093 RepID=A0A642UU23_9ASCO|nr:hypothetical protein TRICI_005809 [Trichomonascus ciferrii]